MTELKTLKDLGFHWSNYRSSKDCFLKKHKQKAYDEDELRQEAIKWAKTNWNDKEWNILLPAEASHFDEVEKVKQWIMNFFNLTEEDLK